MVSAFGNNFFLAGGLVKATVKSSWGKSHNFFSSLASERKNKWLIAHCITAAKTKNKTKNTVGLQWVHQSPVWIYSTHEKHPFPAQTFYPSKYYRDETERLNPSRETTGERLTTKTASGCTRTSRASQLVSVRPSVHSLRGHFFFFFMLRAKEK